MKTLLAGVAIAVVCGTAAMADYYIVQEPTTKRCRIVEERPAPGVGVVIGDVFGARVEAENRMRTVEVCSTSPTVGRGGRDDHDRVIIEEHR